MPYELKPIEVQAGVSTSVDNTLQATRLYTQTDKIRFVGGLPEKIGGWDRLSWAGSFVIQGVPRNVYSYIYNGATTYLVGTHTNLYALFGNTLFNATPVTTGTTTLNNVLGTIYGTLSANSMACTNGSPIVVVTDAAHPFKNGDVLTFSGATAFGGLLVGAINGAKSISNVTPNTYSFNANANATSTVSGGGAAIVRTSRLVTVIDANTMREGDNINVVSVASAVGGIATADITGIRTVRNVTTSGYNIVAAAFATFSASAGGGNFVFSEEIADGAQNSTAGQGYGLGLYGAGLYGVAKQSSSISLPSIWSFDRFGSLIVATRGNQTGLYSWNSSTTTLPALVTNAPTAINYAFVTDNICVTLGASGTPNRIKWSDNGGLTTWTATAQNFAGEDDIEGAGEFLSHAAVRGLNLLFTRQSVYTFRYIGKPFVFETKLIAPNRGIIGRNARVEVNGVVYWMGLSNFYRSSGSSVEIVPANDGLECSIKDYIFQDIDEANGVKAFAWFNARFNEVWFHYPSNGSLECDRIARFNINDNTWVPDTMARTAAEYPAVLTSIPYLTNQTGIVYRHENGYNDDGAILPWSISTPFFNTGAKDTVTLGGVYNDNIISNGDINLTVNTKRYPNQPAGTSTYPIQDGEYNLMYRKSARYWQYTLSGATLNQFWRGGAWQELVKIGGKR